MPGFRAGPPRQPARGEVPSARMARFQTFPRVACSVLPRPPARTPANLGDTNPMANLTPKQVIDLAKDKKATYVDLKFMDFVGIWQHFSIPIYELTEDVFDEG